jgi:rhomboid protease GluP
MLVLLAFRKGRLEDLTFRRMAVMAVLSLLVGCQSSNVDNFAHIGGFLAGAVLMAVLYPGMARIRKRGKRP